MTVREIFDAVAAGTLSPEDAEQLLGSHGYAAVGFHRLDTLRESRTGTPEVIYGASKSPEQLAEIIGHHVAREQPLLVTKVFASVAEMLARSFPPIVHRPAARLLRFGNASVAGEGRVAVVAAGSSDVPIAEEAAETLDFFGVGAERVYDCGVAGLHRLFASADAITACDVIIVIAGMEGALASVVGGLFSAPVIAVPTSVGYGTSFEGLAALLAMMNSCAPGISVVNIDNGFGAAVSATSILRLVAKKNRRA